MSRLTALLPAVLLPSITRGADEEEHGAETASNLPEADLHDSPGEPTGKLALGPGAWETGRTSVCARSPEGPGRNPGPSSFRRAAWPRSLPADLAQGNFLAAPAGPPGHDGYDGSARNLRIGVAINSAPREAGSSPSGVVWRPRYEV